MNVLVTGGGGFLGSHLARRLHEMGHRVSVLGRRRYPGLPPNIIQHQADLCDPKAVSEACREQESVFHAGALPGIWGTQKDFYQTNVDGTRYVIDGCLEHGIRKLVFTSSPSVIYNQTDMENVDESAPYPSHYLSDYPETKALAEQSVIAANGQQDLMTVSLRPHLIWGPGDPHLVRHAHRLAHRRHRGGQTRRGHQCHFKQTFSDQGSRGYYPTIDLSSTCCALFVVTSGGPVRNKTQPTKHP